MAFRYHHDPTTMKVRKSSLDGRMLSTRGTLSGLSCVIAVLRTSDGTLGRCNLLDSRPLAHHWHRVLLRKDSLQRILQLKFLKYSAESTARSARAK